MKSEILRTIPGCPWYEINQAWGDPNIKWCEETLCSWISEPANTWSNLGYIIVAFIIYTIATREKNSSMKLFGVAIFFMGLFSFVYHAANNFVLQVFDFVGMYFYTSAIIVFNLRRMGKITKSGELWSFLGLILLNLLLIPFFEKLLHLPMQLIILVNAITIAITEFKLRMKDNRYQLTPFIKSLVIIVFAEMFSILDVTRTWCDPTNHYVQGHALWHLIGSVSVFYCFQFYRQFKFES